MTEEHESRPADIANPTVAPAVSAAPAAIADGDDDMQDSGSNNAAMTALQNLTPEIIEGELIKAAPVDETRLQPYDRVEAGLAILREELAVNRFDLTTRDGMKAAKQAAAKARKLRSALEASRKGAKKFLQNVVDMINDRAEKIRAEILAIEEPITKKIKDYEAEQERIRVQQEQERRVREEAIRQAMQPLQRALIEVSQSNPDAVRAKIAELSALPVPPFGDQNLVQAWLSTRNDVMGQLAIALSTAERREQDRIEAMRREERGLRMQSANQSITGFLVAFTQQVSASTTALDEQARLQEMDDLFAKLTTGEDPAFIDTVQRTWRDARQQMQAVMVGHREQMEARQRMQREREEFEAARKRMEDERKALEEQMAAQRREMEAREAELRAERDRQNAAEIARQRAEQERQEAEAAAKVAAQRAEEERVAAAEKAKQEAEAAAQRAEQAAAEKARLEAEAAEKLAKEAFASAAAEAQRMDLMDDAINAVKRLHDALRPDAPGDLLVKIGLRLIDASCDDPTLALLRDLMEQTK